MTISRAKRLSLGAACLWLLFILGRALSSPPPAEAALFPFAVSADADVYSLSPDTNYGTNEFLRVGVSGAAEYRAYLKVTIASLPPTQRIRSAKLYLFATDGGNDGGDMIRSESNWLETDPGGIDFNTQPAD